MDYCEIGQRIRKIRKARGLLQEQLAEKVGIPTTHMSHIETANTKLSLSVFIEIAEAQRFRQTAFSMIIPAKASTPRSLSYPPFWNAAMQNRQESSSKLSKAPSRHLISTNNCGMSADRRAGQRLLPIAGIMAGSVFFRRALVDFDRLFRYNL